MNSDSADSPDLFSAVRRVRSFDDVVRQIRDVVLSGQVGPGDRLPSERDLALKLGVSRPTLREGLRTLEAEGLIQIRLGGTGGIYASAPDGQLVGSALESLMRIRQASRWELQEFRRRFEPETAALAAKRATLADVDALGAHVAALIGAIEQDRSETEVAAADFGYHEALAVASHNEVRVAIMLGISQATRHAVETLAVSDDRRVVLAAARELERVTAAIGEGDADGAAARMLAHISLLT